MLATATLISVTASATSLSFGQSEVLTATVVANPPGTNTPSGGTVTFLNGATALGTASLSNGTATLTTTLATGTYQVTASYGGTSTFAASTSTTSSGYIFNVAGNGTFGNTVTVGGVPASSAELANPFGVAVGPDGTTYVADTFNNQIDAVSPNTGLIHVLAGDGTAGDVDGPAVSAEFASPRGLAFDAPLNALFIADRDNNTIRELNLATGAVTTVAGTGTYGDGGTNIPATSADLASPNAVAVGPTGFGLYIADTFNNVVREVNLTTGIITTIAGNGTAGFSGDGGAATSAELFDPSGLAVDGAGNVYIADTDNNVVRKVTANTQVITTIAGTPPPTGPAPTTGSQPNAGYSGDNGPATSAKLASPWGLALNGAGTVLYIADSANNAIREVNRATGIITTVAGNGTFGLSGNNGPATSATLGSPRSVAVDASGNVYIADTLGGTNSPPAATGGSIRLLAGGMGTVTVTVQPFAAIAAGRGAVFSAGVPTGVGNKTGQAIVLTLSNVTNSAAAATKSSYVLTTTIGRRGAPDRDQQGEVRRLDQDCEHLPRGEARRLPEAHGLRAHHPWSIAGAVTLTFNRREILSETT